jgi:hypothetical protein
VPSALAAAACALAVWAAPAGALPRDAVPGPAVALPLAGSGGPAWIVGVRAGSPAARRIARAHGARHVAGDAWLVARWRARRLAGALRARELLAYAEPNRRAGRLAQAPAPDPLSPLTWWRDRVAGGLAPPAAGPLSPLIALVDTQLDVTHPDLGAGITSLGTGPATDVHGTATAEVAAAPANGVGTLGLWPGARTVNVPVPVRLSCADSARGIAAAVAAGAAVINMSYGRDAYCRAEHEQLLRAVKAGVVPVAAAGNELLGGNPLEYPGSLPHVLTVAATGPDDRATGFSSTSAAVDLGAPGVGILTGVPVAFDDDGTPDGYEALDGTSFAAPMVAAAVAWVRAARPRLTADQTAQAVRLGARDVGARGWEEDTGFGVLSVAGALARRVAPPDPLEPNDEFPLVAGGFLGPPAAPVFTGARRSLRALLDELEDPADVYRARIPARTRVRVTLAPSFGDPDLYVYDRRATRFSQGRYVLARSAHSGVRVREALTVGNRSRRPRTVYVAAGIDPGAGLADAGYRLTIRRVR